MGAFFADYLPLLRGIGLGAVVAFIIDDFLSPNSWMVSAWRKWRGPRATIDFHFNVTDGRTIDYQVVLKLGRNSGRVFLTGRAARLVHYLDGTTEWKWKTPLVTLWEAPRGSKGEEVQQAILLRGPEDTHKVQLVGHTLPIDSDAVLLVEVVLNVGGRIERVRKAFEVYTTEPTVTRVIDPSWIPFTPAGPS